MYSRRMSNLSGKHATGLQSVQGQRSVETEKDVFAMTSEDRYRQSFKIFNLSRHVHGVGNRMPSSVSVTKQQSPGERGAGLRNTLNSPASAFCLADQGLTSQRLTYESLTNQRLTSQSLTNQRLTSQSLTNQRLTSQSSTNPSLTNQSLTNLSLNNQNGHCGGCRDRSSVGSTHSGSVEQWGRSLTSFAVERKNDFPNGGAAFSSVHPNVNQFLTPAQFVAGVSGGREGSGERQQTDWVSPSIPRTVPDSNQENRSALFSSCHNHGTKDTRNPSMSREKNSLHRCGSKRTGHRKEHGESGADHSKALLPRCSLCTDSMQKGAYLRPTHRLGQRASKFRQTCCHGHVNSRLLSPKPFYGKSVISCNLRDRNSLTHSWDTTGLYGKTLYTKALCRTLYSRKQTIVQTPGLAYDYDQRCVPRVKRLRTECSMHHLSGHKALSQNGDPCRTDQPVCPARFMFREPPQRLNLVSNKPELWGSRPRDVRAPRELKFNNKDNEHELLSCEHNAKCDPHLTAKSVMCEPSKGNTPAVHQSKQIIIQAPPKQHARNHAILVDPVVSPNPQANKQCQGDRAALPGPRCSAHPFVEAPQSSDNSSVAEPRLTVAPSDGEIRSGRLVLCQSRAHDERALQNPGPVNKSVTHEHYPTNKDGQKIKHTIYGSRSGPHFCDKSALQEAYLRDQFLQTKMHLNDKTQPGKQHTNHDIVSREPQPADKPKVREERRPTDSFVFNKENQNDKTVLGEQHQNDKTDFHPTHPVKKHNIQAMGRDDTTEGEPQTTDEPTEQEPDSKRRYALHELQQNSTTEADGWSNSAGGFGDCATHHADKSVLHEPQANVTGSKPSDNTVFIGPNLSDKTGPYPSDKTVFIGSNSSDNTVFIGANPSDKTVFIGPNSRVKFVFIGPNSSERTVFTGSNSSNKTVSIGTNPDDKTFFIGSDPSDKMVFSGSNPDAKTVFSRPNHDAKTPFSRPNPNDKTVFSGSNPSDRTVLTGSNLSGKYVSYGPNDREKNVLNDLTDESILCEPHPSEKLEDTVLRMKHLSDECPVCEPHFRHKTSPEVPLRNESVVTEPRQTCRPFLCNVCCYHYRTLEELDQHRLARHNTRNTLKGDAVQRLEATDSTLHSAGVTENGLEPSTPPTNGSLVWPALYICSDCSSFLPSEKSLVAHKCVADLQTLQTTDSGVSVREETLTRSSDVSKTLVEEVCSDFTQTECALETQNNFPADMNSCGRKAPNTGIQVSGHTPGTWRDVRGQMGQKKWTTTQSGGAVSERRHKCWFCNATFSYSTHLKVHVRIHTGERPFVCTECGSAFAENGGLARHKRVHTKDRPYVCLPCGKAFSDPSSLRRHLLTHLPDH